jgi:hypothetical protein
MTTIPTGEIAGPPFGCPECAAEGTRTSFPKRGALGSHRLSKHNVSGTSTGSAAYKEGRLRTKGSYVKRTQHAVSFKRKYTKQPKTNFLVEMLGNPSRFISELDSLIATKREEIATHQNEINDLNRAVDMLERFRSTATAETRVPNVFSEVA